MTTPSEKYERLIAALADLAEYATRQVGLNAHFDDLYDIECRRVEKLEEENRALGQRRGATDWLSEVEARGAATLADDFTRTAAQSGRMVHVIRELVRFIRLNIDFDSPFHPVGLHDLSEDARELLR